MNQSVRGGYRGAETRETILNAAERIFAEQHFAAARLEDVAQAVGIRRASLVYYFRSKQELYDAVVDRIFTAMREYTLDRLARFDDPVERVLTVIDSWLDFMVRRPTAPRIVLRMAAESYDETIDPVEFSESALALWERIVREGQAGGAVADADPMHLMHLLASPILNYAVTGQLLGRERRYDAADPARLEPFRQLLHRSARELLTPKNKHPHYGDNIHEA